jgi:hypothetical protein
MLDLMATTCKGATKPINVVENESKSPKLSNPNVCTSPSIEIMIMSHLVSF